MDLEDPSRALMQLALLDQPEGSLEAVALAFALTTPFPMVREEGEWRLSFSLSGIALGEGCPFAEDSGQQSSETPVPRTLVDEGCWNPVGWYRHRASLAVEVAGVEARENFPHRCSLIPT